MPDDLLRLEHVSLAFHRGAAEEVRALDDVFLSQARGSFTVVLGTNGSGKSSLLNVIAGNERVTEGTVVLGDANVTAWPEHRRARLVGRVFQDPLAGTAAELTIAENLALGLRRGQAHRLMPALGRERKARLRDAVARLGMDLEDRIDSPIALLSGGQRQAITLLMATLTSPVLLLLDEHTAALDPRAAEHVVRLTRELVTDAHLTTLMVTHSLGQAVQLGDRVLVMHRGRIVHDLFGLEREGLREADLLRMFDELRWADRLDASATAMLDRTWV